tara:strand:+ start:246 stop:422 length:177 start_codon:yes stop_codon:yes gene_type:complete
MDTNFKLEKIEFKNRMWKSQFSREFNILMEIITNINSTTGKEKKQWEKVIDLYNSKYR